MSSDHQALVVGGGAAGLSAALVLGRARVDTLVVDAGEPSNAAAPAIGGLLGQHDTAPGSLYETGRAQLAELPSVTVLDGAVTALTEGFTATLADGGSVTADRVVLATGMRYRYPEIPGIEEFWGDAVFHCPYCHGWEHRDGRLAVVAEGDAAAHMRPLLRCWSDDVRVVRPDQVAAFEGREGRLAGLRLTDGTLLERDGVLVPTPLEPRDGLAAGLGCATRDLPNVTGMVVTDDLRQTSVPGVFAAGDVAASMQQVSLAIAAGSMAAAALHRSLVFPG